MNAKLEYHRPINISSVSTILETEYFTGESIRFTTGDAMPDYRVWVNDKWVFSISPNHFISFKFIEDKDFYLTGKKENE